MSALGQKRTKQVWAKDVGSTPTSGPRLRRVGKWRRWAWHLYGELVRRLSLTSSPGELCKASLGAYRRSILTQNTAAGGNKGAMRGKPRLVQQGDHDNAFTSLAPLEALIILASSRRVHPARARHHELERTNEVGELCTT